MSVRGKPHARRCPGAVAVGVTVAVCQAAVTWAILSSGMITLGSGRGGAAMAVLGMPFTALLAVTDWLFAGDWNEAATWQTAKAAWVLWPVVPNAVLWAFVASVARERGPFRRICRTALFVAGAQVLVVVLSWAVIGYGWSDGPYDDWVLSCEAPGTWIAMFICSPSLFGGPSPTAAAVIVAASFILNWVFWIAVGTVFWRFRRR